MRLPATHAQFETSRPGNGVAEVGEREGQDVADVAVLLEDVSYRYKAGFIALEKISLAIPRGRSLGLVGPSGCGKTTLLRLMAGLGSPWSGQVRLSIPPGRHPVSLLFQQDTLLPWRTVMQNAMLHHDLAGRHGREEGSRQCRELLSMVGLERFVDAYPHELSGGMRRRAALVAAVAPDPAVLLLDEPFSSVDEPTRIGIHQELLRIVANRSMTLILVTHDLNEAISLCDHVGIMSAGPGRLVELQSTESVGDRSDLLTLRRTEPYLAMYARLWERLGQEIRAASSDAKAGTGDPADA